MRSDRPAWVMLAVSFAFSWSVALALFLTGGIASGPRHLVGGFAFMCGPALGALVACRVFRLPGQELGLAWRGTGWIGVAWLVALGLVAAAAAVSLALPGVRTFSPAAALAVQLGAHAPAEQLAKLAKFPAPLLSALLVGQACLLGPLFNAPLMLSEELGWRGFLWSRWARVPFWRKAWGTGFVWGVWHAPLIAMGHNYPGEPAYGILFMIAFCMLLTPTLHHVRERGGSVWHACMFHGTINATSTLAALCVTGSSPLWRGLPGAAGFVVLAASTGIVWCVRRAPGARLRAKRP